MEHSFNTVDWTPIIIALSAIFGLIITIILHLLSAKEDRKLRFTELMENFQHDITEISRKLFTATTLESNIRALRDMLHVLQRLSYLRKLDKINDDMMEFFKPFFTEGATMLNLLEMLHKDNSNKEIFPYVIWWIEKNNLKPKHHNSLPPKLLEIYLEALSGKRLVFRNNKWDLMKLD